MEDSDHKYADDAKILYNSVDTALTVDAAVAGHVQSNVSQGFR